MSTVSEKISRQIREEARNNKMEADMDEKRLNSKCQYLKRQPDIDKCELNKNRPCEFETGGTCQEWLRAERERWGFCPTCFLNLNNADVASNHRDGVCHA